MKGRHRSITGLIANEITGLRGQNWTEGQRKESYVTRIRGTPKLYDFLSILITGESSLKKYIFEASMESVLNGSQTGDSMKCYSLKGMTREWRCGVGGQEELLEKRGS